MCLPIPAHWRYCRDQRTFIIIKASSPNTHVKINLGILTTSEARREQGRIRWSSTEALGRADRPDSTTEKPCPSLRFPSNAATTWRGSVPSGRLESTCARHCLERLTIRFQNASVGRATVECVAAFQSLVLETVSPRTPPSGRSPALQARAGALCLPADLKALERGIAGGG
jgi:hypothetical protein